MEITADEVVYMLGAKEAELQKTQQALRAAQARIAELEAQLKPAESPPG